MATIEERLALIEEKLGIIPVGSGNNVPGPLGGPVGEYSSPDSLGRVRLWAFEAELANGLGAELARYNLTPPKYFYVHEVMDDPGLNEQQIQNIAVNTLANAGYSMIGSHGIARPAVKKISRRGHAFWDRGDIMPETMACESPTAAEAAQEAIRKWREQLERTKKAFG